MDAIQKNLLAQVAQLHEVPEGAYNIRANGKRAYHRGCEGVRIESKTDKEGIDIIIEPGVVASHVYIPVVVTEEGIMKDIVEHGTYVRPWVDKKLQEIGTEIAR